MKEIAGLPRALGTYAVVFHAVDTSTIVAGRLGALTIAPGYYVYVGSAGGPGGIAARLGRHLRGGRRRHWHVDYLRAVLDPVGAGYCLEEAVSEHTWADQLGRMRESQPGPAGFGSSDCRCQTHLFKVGTSPERQLKAGLAGFIGLGFC